MLATLPMLTSGLPMLCLLQVFLAYIMPGALVLKVEYAQHHWMHTIAGAACVVLGVVMGLAGVLNTLVFSK